MKSNYKKIILILLKVVFIIYVAILAYFVFFSERYGRDMVHTEYRYNLTMFKELGRFFKYRKNIGLEGFIVNMFGNILAFAPFGFLFPAISKDRRKLKDVVLNTFFFSLSIELIQLISKVGVFDVDDLFMNTLGGLLGFLTFKMVNFFRKRIMIIR